MIALVHMELSVLAIDLIDKQAHNLISYKQCICWSRYYHILLIIRQ